MIPRLFWILNTALNLYSVPLASGVLGWIFGSQIVIWLLDLMSADPSIYQAFLLSAPLMYCVKFASAILFFVIADRYLN